MIRVEKTRKLIPGANGIHHAVLDLQVSIIAELPALGAIVDGMIVDGGSIAEVIQDDLYATLDGTDGKWHSGGEEVA